MVTGIQYNAEAGDRMYIPRGTTYACMTHQGVSYYWCSKKAEMDGSNTNTWPGAENDAEQEKAGEMPWWHFRKILFLQSTYWPCLTDKFEEKVFSFQKSDLLMVSLNFSQNQSEGDPDLSTTENEDANTTQVKFWLILFVAQKHVCNLLLQYFYSLLQ